MIDKLTPLQTTETFFAYGPTVNSLSQEETIQNLINQNAKLQEENIKFHNRLITLENNLKEKSEKTYMSYTDTSINFFLPSEIKTIWETIAYENIGDCFIDFFPQPVITFHLVQEMFYIMQSMIKERISSIIKKTLDVLNISQSDSNYEEVKSSLFNTLKPFLQNNVIKIFDDENSKSNKAFNDSFCNNFLMFYNQEIIPLMSTPSNEDDNTNNAIEENINIYEIVHSISFKKMISNIKRIILFIELNNQQLSFQIDDFITREISFDLTSYKDKDNLNVNGKTKENQSKLILLNPPKLRNGNNYPNLLKIILPYDQTNVSSKNIYLKGDLTSPGISLRSTSYQNIYHYTEKEDEVCKSQIDIEDTDNTKDDNNKLILNEILYENSTSPVNTDMTNTDKIRTERLSKFIQGKNGEHVFFSNCFNKSHTRSLSKNSTISDKIYSKNNDTAINSYKKAKIYRLKRKGKNIQLEELKSSKFFEFNSKFMPNNQIQKIKPKVKEEKVFRNNTNSNVNVNPMSFIKTNTNTHKDKAVQLHHAKKLSITSISKKSTKGALLKGKKNTKSNKSNCSTTTKKTGSVDKNIIEYKTNAVTKVKVDELLSCKNKKQFMDFRKTFVHTSMHIDNYN